MRPAWKFAAAIVASRMARFHTPAIGQSIGEILVSRGFLARESDLTRVDVILLGGYFRYTPRFWEHVGALSRDESGRGWRVGARTPEEQAAVRGRFAQVWQEAGAPEGWARMEAGAALEALLANGPAPAWNEVA